MLTREEQDLALKQARVELARLGGLGNNKIPKAKRVARARKAAQVRWANVKRLKREQKKLGQA